MKNVDENLSKLKTKWDELLENRFFLTVFSFILGGVMSYLSWDLYNEITAKETLNQEVTISSDKLQFFYYMFGKWGVVFITSLLAIFSFGVALYTTFGGTFSDKPVDIEEVTRESTFWKKVIYLWIGPPLLAWSLFIIKAIIEGNLSVNYALYLALGAALGALIGIVGGERDENNPLVAIVVATSFLGTIAVNSFYFN